MQNNPKEFIRLLLLFVAIIAPWLIGVWYVGTQNEVSSPPVRLVNFEQDTLPRVDHSQFAVLKKDFATPQEVTQACLSCHNLTAGDVMKTAHWTWDRDYKLDNGQLMSLGKKNILNNFCIGVASNESRCTSCHIGYGWKDKTFDFSDSSNVDCMVCHDKTGTYKKFPTDAGYPVTEEKAFGGKTFLPPDFSYIAQHVGSPGIENCGACHFVGGGGNNVKHGDIANDLLHVTREVDVHMAHDGANMTCTDCHETNRHNISGNLYSIASTDENRVTCSTCHTDEPHANQTLNKHVARVACQTCHIPEYAKKSATKMHWDWSTAGRFTPEGKPIVEKDSMGNSTYDTKKGSFVWQTHVTPEYYWFNGRARHYVLGEKIDTTVPVQVNTLLGDYDDKQAQIIPVKVHRGKQIYDKKNNILIQAHLFGKDSAAFWKSYNWDLAAKAGMEYVDMPYSGDYGFTSTEMYWPINHMVAPADESLTCNDCHSHTSRLAGLGGFYLTGRDFSPLLDRIGWLLILASFAGVIIHAGLRMARKQPQ